MHQTFFILTLSFILSITSSGLSYELVSETHFTLRIHYNSPSNPQQPRIAGADHQTRIPQDRIVALRLGESDGSIVIQNNEFNLNKDDVGLLKGGSEVVVGDEFRIYLSSDATNRESAILVVRPSKGDNTVSHILNLRLIKK